MEEDAAEQERFREGIQVPREEPKQEPQKIEPIARDYRPGDTVTFASGDAVTLHSYTSPAESKSRIWQPEEGQQFAAIDVEGCAGRNSEDGQALFNPYFFALQMPDNTRLGPTLPQVIEPGFGHTNLEPGECVRGLVSFQVPQNQRPSYVRLENSMRLSVTGPQETAKWAVAS